MQEKELLNVIRNSRKNQVEIGLRRRIISNFNISSSLNKLRLFEVNIIDSTFSGPMNWFSISNSIIINSKFMNNSMICFNADSCLINNTEFINCNISLGVLNESILSDCKFINCNLLKNNFDNSELTNCTFENCNLSYSDFSDTQGFTGKILNCKIIKTLFNEEVNIDDIREIRYALLNENRKKILLEESTFYKKKLSIDSLKDIC